MGVATVVSEGVGQFKLIFIKDQTYSKDRQCKLANRS